MKFDFKNASYIRTVPFTVTWRNQNYSGVIIESEVSVGGMPVVDDVEVDWVDSPPSEILEVFTDDFLITMFQENKGEDTDYKIGLDLSI